MIAGLPLFYFIVSAVVLKSSCEVFIVAICNFTTRGCSAQRAAPFSQIYLKIIAD